MKRINLYIIEKLHLNKDIEVTKDKELKKDNEFFCISTDIRFNEINIKLYNPMTVKKITEKEITYITDANKTLTKEYFINSNGFYEMKPNSSFTAICMPIDYGIELLESLLKEDITREFLYKYFDEEDEWIDDYPIKPDYTKDEVRKRIDILKTENYIDEKLHLNKDYEKPNNEIKDYIVSLIDWEVYRTHIEKTVGPLIEKWIDKNNVTNIKAFIPTTFNGRVPKEIWDKINGKITLKSFKELLGQLGFRKGYNCLCKSGNHKLDIFHNSECIYFDADLFDILITKEEKVTEKLHLNKDIDIKDSDKALYKLDIIKSILKEDYKRYLKSVIELVKEWIEINDFEDISIYTDNKPSYRNFKEDEVKDFISVLSTKDYVNLRNKHNILNYDENKVFAKDNSGREISLWIQDDEALLGTYDIDFFIKGIK